MRQRQQALGNRALQRSIRASSNAPPLPPRPQLQRDPVPADEGFLGKVASVLPEPLVGIASTLGGQLGAVLGLGGGAGDKGPPANTAPSSPPASQNWLGKLTGALAKQVEAKQKELQQAVKEAEALAADPGKQMQAMEDLHAKQQELGMLMDAMNNTIKSIGEATQSAARRM